MAPEKAIQETASLPFAKLQKEGEAKRLTSDSGAAKGNWASSWESGAPGPGLACVSALSVMGEKEKAREFRWSQVARSALLFPVT